MIIVFVFDALHIFTSIYTYLLLFFQGHFFCCLRYSNVHSTYIPYMYLSFFLKYTYNFILKSAANRTWNPCGINKNLRVTDPCLENYYTPVYHLQLIFHDKKRVPVGSFIYHFLFYPNTQILRSSTQVGEIL